MKNLGSSPRVRGTRALGQPQLATFRLIPAGAGNTSVDVAEKYADAAHPRGCGEHLSI